MGEQNVRTTDDAELRRIFMRALLRDVQALEMMLDRGMIESGVNRIGAEQEVVLVDEAWRPAPVADELLGRINDEHFTHELARFNLEFNLDPLAFESDCLSRLEHDLNHHLARAREAAHAMGTRILLTGILPTLSKDDLSLDNITDRPRYHELNDALMRIRGGPSRLSIKGVDEINVTHDSVMLEACNTSFQVHFQVDPDNFATRYNIAQAVAGPTLAAAVNSPMLFARRLWRETRIALFQQSIDTRADSPALREFPPRVSFGTRWVEDSVLDIFQEDIARFKTLFYIPPESDPVKIVEEGGVPKLSALRLHNGTVYRWNRPCYGISDGKPHLRIENRVFPSGPTVIDEVGNAALWFGLMRGLLDEHPDITEAIDFDDAASNFLAAARFGLDAQLSWIKMTPIPARELLAIKLIPLARRGLASAGIDAADIERYLSVVERRIANGRTGAAWAAESAGAMKGKGSRSARMTAIAASMHHQESAGIPVADWTHAQISDATLDRRHILTVGQYMVTDLFTVNEQDIVDFAASLMQWKHLRHIPVEDDEHRLVGIVSPRAILRHLLSPDAPTRAVPIADIMTRDPVCATPQTTTLEAMELMARHHVGCLPVVRDGKLVGIVTDHDIMAVARPLLEAHLQSGQGPTPPATLGA